MHELTPEQIEQAFDVSKKLCVMWAKSRKSEEGYKYLLEQAKEISKSAKESKQSSLLLSELLIDVLTYAKSIYMMDKTAAIRQKEGK